MGIFERPPEAMLDRMEQALGFPMPREHGVDTVEAIRAMRDGRAHVFMAMGGNFLSAAPDTAVDRGGAAQLRADRSCRDQAQPLAPRPWERGPDPADARPHRARLPRRQGAARHRRGLDERGARLRAARSSPPSEQLRSEVQIVCDLAQRTVGDIGVLRWSELANDYDRIRDLIEAAIPGFERFNERMPAGVHAAPPAA